MAALAGTLASSTKEHDAQCFVPTPEIASSLPAQKERGQEANPGDRDSGVFVSDDESIQPPSRPSSSSFSLKQSPSIKSASSPQRTDSTARRLRRPAELNLGANTLADSSRPKSELEMRYDLITKSQTQSKAALKSPTQLLRNRLNLSPKKEQYEKVRMFTPPKPMLNGCILPGPAAQMEAFTSSAVRARTDKTNRPAWWCKTDKLVVFDGAEQEGGDELTFKTRTSKGLSIARRRGDTETVIIPMDCAHCQEMLNRHEWKYDMQVCKRSVCWDCKERCKWELDQETKIKEQITNVTEGKADTSRERADSMLQESVREEELMAKVGIEHGPKSPIEVVGGIEERLEGDVEATD